MYLSRIVCILAIITLFSLNIVATITYYEPVVGNAPSGTSTVYHRIPPKGANSFSLKYVMGLPGDVQSLYVCGDNCLYLLSDGVVLRIMGDSIEPLFYAGWRAKNILRVIGDDVIIWYGSTDIARYTSSGELVWRVTRKEVLSPWVGDQYFALYSTEWGVIYLYDINTGSLIFERDEDFIYIGFGSRYIFTVTQPISPPFLIKIIDYNGNTIYSEDYYNITGSLESFVDALLFDDYTIAVFYTEASPYNVVWVYVYYNGTSRWNSILVDTQYGRPYVTGYRVNDTAIRLIMVLSGGLALTGIVDLESMEFTVEHIFNVPEDMTYKYRVPEAIAYIPANGSMITIVYGNGSYKTMDLPDNLTEHTLPSYAHHTIIDNRKLVFYSISYILAIDLINGYYRLIGPKGIGYSNHIGHGYFFHKYYGVWRLEENGISVIDGAQLVIDYDIDPSNTSISYALTLYNGGLHLWKLVGDQRIGDVEIAGPENATEIYDDAALFIPQNSRYVYVITIHPTKDSYSLRYTIDKETLDIVSIKELSFVFVGGEGILLYQDMYRLRVYRYSRAGSLGIINYEIVSTNRFAGDKLYYPSPDGRWAVIGKRVYGVNAPSSYSLKYERQFGIAFIKWLDNDTFAVVHGGGNWYGNYIPYPWIPCIAVYDVSSGKLQHVDTINFITEHFEDPVIMFGKGFIAVYDMYYKYARIINGTNSYKIDKVGSVYAIDTYPHLFIVNKSRIEILSNNNVINSIEIPGDLGELVVDFTRKQRNTIIIQVRSDEFVNYGMFYVLEPMIKPREIKEVKYFIYPSFIKYETELLQTREGEFSAKSYRIREVHAYVYMVNGENVGDPVSNINVKLYMGNDVYTAVSNDEGLVTFKDIDANGSYPLCLDVDGQTYIYPLNDLFSRVSAQLKYSPETSITVLGFNYTHIDLSIKQTYRDLTMTISGGIDTQNKYGGVLDDIELRYDTNESIATITAYSLDSSETRIVHGIFDEGIKLGCSIEFEKRAVLPITNNLTIPFRFTIDGYAVLKTVVNKVMGLNTSIILETNTSIHVDSREFLTDTIFTPVFNGDKPNEIYIAYSVDFIESSNKIIPRYFHIVIPHVIVVDDRGEIRVEKIVINGREYTPSYIVLEKGEKVLTTRVYGDAWVEVNNEVRESIIAASLNLTDWSSSEINNILNISSIEVKIIYENGGSINYTLTIKDKFIYMGIVNHGLWYNKTKQEIESWIQSGVPPEEFEGWYEEGVSSNSIDLYKYCILNKSLEYSTEHLICGMKITPTGTITPTTQSPTPTSPTTSPSTVPGTTTGSTASGGETKASETPSEGGVSTGSIAIIIILIVCIIAAIIFIIRRKR